MSDTPKPRCPRCGEWRWTEAQPAGFGHWCRLCKVTHETYRRRDGGRKHYPDFDPEDVTPPARP